MTEGVQGLRDLNDITETLESVVDKMESDIDRGNGTNSVFGVFCARLQASVGAVVLYSDDWQDRVVATAETRHVILYPKL